MREPFRHIIDYRTRYPADHQKRDRLVLRSQLWPRLLRARHCVYTPYPQEKYEIRRNHEKYLGSLIFNEYTEDLANRITVATDGLSIEILASLYSL